MTHKTSVAALAASLFMLGTGAHAAGIPGLPGGLPGQTQAPSTPGASTSTGKEAPPIGVQAVPDTPAANLPSHPDHAPIPQPSPQPGLEATAMQPEKAARAGGQLIVVSPGGNDAGTGAQGQPFRTIAKAISVAGPGAVIKVLDGTYAERIVIGDTAKAGTADAKITIEGESSPRIVPGSGGGALVQVRKPNWVIDGFNLDLQGQPIFGVTFEGDVQGSVLANSELHHGTGGGGVTAFNNARGATLENNHIHDFVRTTGNQDSHGVVVQPTSHDITVRNNDIHDNSGDSVQCLGPEGFSSLPPADGLLVENNHLYGNRENAVDIKTCHHVVVRNNRMHGFHPTTTAKGDAVVIHYSAKSVLIEDNDIYDAAKGISVGGNHEGPVPSGVVLRRNRVHDITTAGGGEGTGIRLENSNGTQVLNNTLVRTATGLILGHGTGGPTNAPAVENNLVVEAPLAVDLGTQAPGLKMGANLFPDGGQFKQAGKLMALDQFKAASGDSTSSGGSADLSAVFGPGTAAVDKGLDVGLPYCGAAPDIGAVELGC